MATAANAPLALTMGEPAGIGGEIALKAWLARDTNALPPFFMIDDPDRLRLLATGLHFDVPIQEVASPSAASTIWPDALPVLALSDVPPTSMGQPSPGAAGAVLRSIDTAVALALGGEVAAVVTNPIQKATLYTQGFTFQGHTDYIASLCAGSDEPPFPVMMLAAPGLRVVPVTIHEPLASVPASLTTAKIIETAEITVSSLKREFGMAAPRLAVCGLNPHAGEDGTIGDEEIRVIKPAIAKLRAAGMIVSGPHAADSMFHAAARDTYDAALCMYHDQALIPIKTIAFESAVNVTLGLPIVRTSPDHGTALDIAGTGAASPLGLIAALRLAADMAGRRAS